MGMTIGSFDFKYTLFDGEEGNIESTTSEIEDEDVLFLISLLVKTVGNSGSSWLVDDSENL